MPKTLNSLMKHLRDSGIDINGSSQTRRLKNIGYYHGYKGYRFAGTSSNRLPLTTISQVTVPYDFDTQLKTLFYPRVMAIETVLKNYTLEAVLRDAKSEAFEDTWRASLTDYRSCSGRPYRVAWERGQRLRSEIDGIIFTLKDFRNAIAHNGVIVDVRFKSGSINTGVAQLLKQETGVGKIDLADITDYVILLVYVSNG